MEIVACLLVLLLLTILAIFANDLSQNSLFIIPGRSISVEVRARIVGMLENGAKANQVAMKASTHRASELNRNFFKQAQ